MANPLSRLHLDGVLGKNVDPHLKGSRIPDLQDRLSGCQNPSAFLGNVEYDAVDRRGQVKIAGLMPLGT